MSAISVEQRVRIGSVAELRERGCTVISAGGHGIAVFAHEGGFSAVDNRCPHMGFPLSRGTVRDGLLTCHWHHARFDLDGGGTLDPFADNVRSFPVQVEATTCSSCWRTARPTTAAATGWRASQEGLEHGLDFVLAKSTIASARHGRRLGRGAADDRPLRPALPRAGLGHGHDDPDRASGRWCRRWPPKTGRWRCSTARCASPRIRRAPSRASISSRLPATSVPLARLKTWFRRAVEVRDEDGAERVLQTAIAGGASPAELADMLFVGGDRPRVPRRGPRARFHQQGLRVPRSGRLDGGATWCCRAWSVACAARSGPRSRTPGATRSTWSSCWRRTSTAGRVTPGDGRLERRLRRAGGGSTRGRSERGRSRRSAPRSNAR